MVNVCTDTLSRVFLEVLSHRADHAILSLRPGEGLLHSNSPWSRSTPAALDSIMSSAQKGLAAAQTGKTLPSMRHDDHHDENEKRLRAISHACATLNDMEVAVDYVRRLELKFMDELTASYAAGKKETEQLRACVRTLTPVMDSMKEASSHIAERLIDALLTRVRNIVNDTVGGEGMAGTGGGGLGVGSKVGGVSVGSGMGAVGSGFSAAVMGGVGVVGGGANSTMLGLGMNYNLDDEAYELNQIGEGYMGRICNMIQELINPLRMYLTPKLSDTVILGVIGCASKRLEASIRRNQFTALGALALDSDFRFFVNFAKDIVNAPELLSNISLYKACNPLSRLAQVALLMNVDDLEDVLDLISISKKKRMWDLSLNDAKAFLTLRVDFEARKVNELLQISDDD